MPRRPGDHDVGEILADAAPQRKGGRGRRGDVGGAELVDEIGLDAPHEIGGAVEHRPCRGKAFPHIVGDLGIERDLPAGKQEVRGRVRADVAGHHHVGAHLFPRRRLRRGLGQRLDRDPRRDLDREVVMGFLEPDPGHVIAEEVEALAPLDRHRGNLERGGMHALARPVDRRQMQHVVRIGDLGGILVGGGLADVVDHASASHTASDRSSCARCEESMVSESFISAFSLQQDQVGIDLGGVRGAQAGRDRGRDLLRRRQAAVGDHAWAARRDAPRCGRAGRPPSADCWDRA